jgi:hypothetical protein
MLGSAVPGISGYILRYILLGGFKHGFYIRFHIWDVIPTKVWALEVAPLALLP